MAEDVLHRFLILDEAVKHIPGKPQVHATLPVIQRRVLLEIPLHQFLRWNVPG